MWSSAKALIVGAALAGSASALWVTEGSPCEKHCGNSLSSTTRNDMVCRANEIGATAAGGVWKKCIECQLQSPYTHPTNSQSDLQWLLYNMRYSLSYCMFGKPQALIPEDSYGGPCRTSTGCGQLESSINFKNLTTSTGALDYCSAWVEDYVAKCTPCLHRGDEPNPKYWGNYVTILEAACLQNPKPGILLSLEGSPFSTTPMKITTPSEAPLSTYTPDTSGISLGAKVGIAAGAIILILFLSGCMIVCLGKRRRRRYLRRLEEKHRHKVWPAHAQNQGEIFDTPMSQKPLRGWEDSPTSAHTDQAEQSFPRYFSPYNSQYNSPVIANDNGAGPSNMMTAAWPAESSVGTFPNSTQEKLQQMMHEQQGAYEPPQQIIMYEQGLTPVTGASIHTFGAQGRSTPQREIGLAFGGDDPSIRSKPSNQSIQSHHSQSAYTWSPSKGKANAEEDMGYELHDVDSSGSVRPPQTGGSTAPVLGHPGYGRKSYSPPQSRG